MSVRFATLHCHLRSGASRPERRMAARKTVGASRTADRGRARLAHRGRGSGEEWTRAISHFEARGSRLGQRREMKQTFSRPSSFPLSKNDLSRKNFFFTTTHFVHISSPCTYMCPRARRPPLAHERYVLEFSLYFSSLLSPTLSQLS